MLMLLVSSALAQDTVTAPLAGPPDEVRPLDLPEGSPIINGEPATSENYPQAGAMIMDMDLDLGSMGSGNYRMFVCSSTLIAPDVVMLAAHCVDESSFTYGMGTMDINEMRWTRQADLTRLDGTHNNPDWPDDSVVVADWVQNHLYDPNNFDVGIAENNDIALLFLDEPVLDTPYAYIPTEDEGDQLVEGAEVTIVGWGQQEATGWGESPEEGTYAIKYMGESPLGEIGDAEFQVGPDEDDVRKCHGDSGGPTFTRIDTDAASPLRVVGVTSHSYDYSDCEEKGGVDTRVMAHRDWIEEQMQDRCDDGTRAWCDVTGLPVPPMPTLGPDEEERAKACGCATTTTPSIAIGAVVGALALARRRLTSPGTRR